MPLPGSRRFNVLVGFGLPFLVAAIYWPILSHGFIAYDDPDYVSANARVLAGVSWANLHWAFTTTFAANYFPLTWVTLMLQAMVFGRWAGGYHLTSVVVHAANAVLLWRVLAKMTGRSGRAAVGAALFAVHPMHVESVAWVAEWKDVLSTFFVLLCLVCYDRYVCGSKAVFWYMGLLVCFAISLLAKPMYVSLAGVLLLLDIWPLRRLSLSRRCGMIYLEKVPIVLMGCIAAGAALFAQSRGRALAPANLLPLSIRIGNAAVGYTRYLQKLVLPTGLAVFYPYSPNSAIQVGGAVVVLTAITVAAMWRSGKWPSLGVGWAWFLMTLVPVIGLVQVGAQSMADRYSYFPSIGLFIAATWTLADLAERRSAVRAAAVLAGVVIGGYAVLARQQVGYWQNTRTLFDHAAAVTTNNWVADLQLGNLACDGGDLATGAGYFGRLIQLQPLDGRGYNGLANCLVDRNVGRAVSLYQQALRCNSGSSLFHLNLAKAFAREGDRDAALAECRVAQQLDPASSDASELARRLSQ